MTGRRGRPRRDDRPRTRAPADEILWAASTLFASKGIAATSTAEIARRAGLQQPSIFYYFPTKDDIIRSIVDQGIVRPLEALEAVAGSRSDPAVKLFAVVAFHVRHDLSEPHDLTVVLNEAWRLPRDRYAGWYEGAARYTQGVQAIVEAGVRRRSFLSVDVFAAAMGVIGMCNWTIRWYHRDGRLSPEEIGDALARHVLRGLLRDQSRLDHIAERATVLADRLGLDRIADDDAEEAVAGS